MRDSERNHRGTGYRDQASSSMMIRGTVPGTEAVAEPARDQADHVLEMPVVGLGDPVPGRLRRGRGGGGDDQGVGGAAQVLSRFGPRGRGGSPIMHPTAPPDPGFSTVQIGSGDWPGMWAERMLAWRS
jgi:hypothetical protein